MTGSSDHHHLFPQTAHTHVKHHKSCYYNSFKKKTQHFLELLLEDTTPDPKPPKPTKLQGLTPVEGGCLTCRPSPKLGRKVALPETNRSPLKMDENGWLEDYFPFRARPIFRGYVKLPEGIPYRENSFYNPSTLRQTLLNYVTGSVISIFSYLISSQHF